jgi:hypothetical protein
VLLSQVAGRVFYSLGSQLGHFLFYCIQAVTVISSSMALYWSPATGPTAHNHLRVFLGLKLVSFCLSGLQLKSGFPPRASFDGGGRQQFFFFRKPDWQHMMGFYMFQVGLVALAAALVLLLVTEEEAMVLGQGCAVMYSGAAMGTQDDALCSIYFRTLLMRYIRSTH